ncbi:MAG: efflux RND transporter periplasmic adaptor subunit [Dehalococcoidia bacterium]|jgi:multidrug resistance efflux pump
MANTFNERIKSIFATTRNTVIFIIVAVVVLGGLITLAYLGYDSYKYYSTDNAYINAPLIPVVAYTSSQIITLDVNYGSYLERGQKIATVGQPRPSNVADVLGSKDVPMGRANIESPVDGYVAAIWAYPGAAVAQGSPIVTLYDVSDTWVIANVTEAQLYRIEPDQDVEITVDALGGVKLTGKVVGIAGATAATFSLLPQNNTTGNFVKVAQVVPVKITINNPDNYILIPGSSVEVKIDTK